MSGGVDSSVAALLLARQGYDVIGVSLKMVGQSVCCGIKGIEDARGVAHQLGIPFYAINCMKEFDHKVIDYFCNSYEKGFTPNPCVVCNRLIKFGFLLRKANEMGIRHIATGHYAKVEKKGNFWLLKKGRDINKDQSYFLYSLSQEQLGSAIFPLGGMKKDNVRAIAKKSGLKIYDKPGSQEICFIPDNDYKKFIIEKGYKGSPGLIVDSAGKVLGEHRGIAFYTIGQRSGLGISCGVPRYVISINRDKNTIVVGTDRETFSKGLVAGDVNWVSIREPEKEIRAEARIRYRHKPAKAIIRKIGSKMVEVAFSKLQRSITPGQSVVFYKKDVVIGGGIIEKAIMIILLLAGIFTVKAGAQEMPEIVVTGSRIASGFHDVTVINRQQIEQSKAGSVAELLNTAAGVDIQSRGDYGVQSDITLRGSTYQQVLVLVDGVRVNDSQTAHHNMDIPVAVNDIERIEVLHGAASSIYGADAFGGVINIITRDITDDRADFCVSGGQFNTINGFFNVSHKWDKFGQSVSAGRKKSDGFHYDTEYDLIDISGISTLDSKKAKIKLLYGYTDKEFGAYDFYTPGFHYPSKEATVTRYGSLRITTKEIKNMVVEPVFFWRRHDDEFTLDSTLNPASVNEHTTLQYGGELIFRAGGFAGGFEMSREEIGSSNLGNHARNRGGIFTEYAGEKNKGFRYNLGLRGDNSGWGWNFCPTAGLNRNISPDWSFVLSAGKSFRVPSFTELYYNQYPNYGSGILKPEEAVSAETGVIFNDKNKLAFKVFIFDRLEYNLIDWVGDTVKGPWRAQNIGTGSMAGIETVLQKKWEKIEASINYSYNGSSRQQDYFSKYSLHYPAHQLGIRLSSSFNNGIRSDCNAVYKKRLGENGYLLLNLMITAEFKSMEVFIKADNIFNASYEEIKGIPSPGRWVTAGIRNKGTVPF